MIKGIIIGVVIGVNVGLILFSIFNVAKNR